MRYRSPKRPPKTSLLYVTILALIVFAVCGLSTLAPPPLSRTELHFPLARKAMEFLDAGSDPFHVVHKSKEILQSAGFVELQEGRSFHKVIHAGGKYYFTRNRSTLIAFCVGLAVTSEYPVGFKVIGGHTDSPNLRVKPRSKRSKGDGGCTQLGVECYGGGLWYTWFDRDLGLSGRVLVRNPNSGLIQQRLIKIDRSLLRISSLAIHMQTAKEREAFVVNKEDHLSPILSLEVEKALNDKKDSDLEVTDLSTSLNKNGWTEYQEPALLQVLAHDLNVSVTDICDFELNLFDVQKASIGGSYGEFLQSARLDNLASCFLAVQALRDYVEMEELLSNDADVSMIILYDHEEVGSESAVGAASPILKDAVRRISAALHGGIESTDLYEACARKSFVLSSDQAHAIHPNYSNKHEKMHQPRMNQGMVIKRNSNQRYATNPITGLIMREIARRADLKAPQEFVVRQDCGCGSTIGPRISASTGIRTIDMGCPQLSMHSIRETMGVCDLTNGLALFRAFFTYFRQVDDAVEQ